MKKNKNIGLLIAITILIVIAIASILFVSQSVGKATKAIDSKAMIEEKTTSTYLPDTTQLTEFNIPTKEPLDTTSISQTFKENTEIDLKLDNSTTALSVTGNANLLSEAALVRIILVDSEKHEYLVYETSSLLSENNKDIKFENICEETCVFDKSITPVAIKIQVEDATLNLSSVNTLTNEKQFTEIKDIKTYKQEILKSQNQAKIEKYNSAQKSWTAGETSVSNLSYEEQKRLFTREDGTIPEYLPNLQGFLYYKGGIFTLKETSNNSRTVDDTTIQPPINPPEAEPDYILPDSWDWRNVHGKNWLTSVKNQGGVGTCWAFAMMGTLESQINLYYNQHLNLDLSEQMLADCYSVTWPYPDENLNYNCLSAEDGYNLLGCRLVHAGIADESCDPYVGRWNYNQSNCSEENICSNWNSRMWKINNWHTFFTAQPVVYVPEWLGNKSEIDFKKELIQNGPLWFSIFENAHAVVLVGYENLNWEIAEICDNNSICLNGECISNSCNNLGELIIGSYNGTTFWSAPAYELSGIRTYECYINDNNQSVFGGINTTDCTSYQISINGQCITAPNPPFPAGFRTCNKINDYKILEYNPNNQETIWIFKNSWGEDWGDNGYSKIIVPGDLTAETYLGPITPPTDQSYWPADFNNSINCVDEDGDHYCNWGISEQKPSTCPSFCKPEKDCDDSNPDLLGFKSKTDLRCRYRYEIQN